MKRKNDINQLAFDFSPIRADYRAPAVIEAPVVAVQTVAGTNATFEVSPGSFRRVHFIRETLHGRYCEIQFPGATYANGRPRIQSINRAVVTLDPF